MVAMRSCVTDALDMQHDLTAVVACSHVSEQDLRKALRVIESSQCIAQMQATWTRWRHAAASQMRWRCSTT